MINFTNYNFYFNQILFILTLMTYIIKIGNIVIVSNVCNS